MANTAPRLSNNVISVVSKTKDSISIRWTKATDAETPSSRLLYTVTWCKLLTYGTTMSARLVKESMTTILTLSKDLTLTALTISLFMLEMRVAGKTVMLKRLSPLLLLMFLTLFL